MVNKNGTLNGTFETTNRKLEQFLYLHKIVACGQHKSEDAMNVWEYQRTPELERVVAEYKELYTVTAQEE